MDIPKFRYLEDALKLVKSIDREITETEQVVKKQHKMLAYLRTPKEWIPASFNRVCAALAVFDIAPEGGDAARKRLNKLKKAIDPKLDKVVVPGLKQLKSQYSVAEDLYGKYQALDAIETQIKMQFSDARDLQRATDEIRKVKGKIQKQLKEVFTYLNDVANAHVPRSFQDYMDAIRQEVQEHVHFEKSELFLYANVSDKGSIIFTYYLMLENAMNDEGEVAPHLYVAIQWVLGNPKENEDASVKVFLEHEYELPNQLIRNGSGIEVDSAQQAVKALSTMLEAEGFASSLGVIPLALQLKIQPGSLSTSLFSYRDYISRVAIDGNTLMFVLKRSSDIGATQESVTKIAQQLYLEVKQIIRRAKETRIRMKIEKKGANYVIVFNIIGNSQGEFNIYDAEFLKDKFGLNDTQLRKIVNILNQGG